MKLYIQYSVLKAKQTKDFPPGGTVTLVSKQHNQNNIP